MDNKDLIEKLTEIFSKGSVNYVEPSPPVDNTDCLKAFNQYAKTELFNLLTADPEFKKVKLKKFAPTPDP